MVMGLKYSFIACNHPHEILQFTLNHLDEIENIIGKLDSDETALEAKKCVQRAVNEIVEVGILKKFSDL